MTKPHLTDFARNWVAHPDRHEPCLYEFRRNDGSTFSVWAYDAASAQIVAQMQHDQAEADKRQLARKLASSNSKPGGTEP